jgi:hypothetical protein
MVSPEFPCPRNSLGWVVAQELRPGDELLNHEGGCVRVEGLASGDPAPVYNMRVAEYHTYFVGSLFWDFAVWSHKMEVCGGGGASVAPNTGPVVLKTGDLFERSFQTSKGPVDLLAETVVEGDTLILKDVVVYGRSPSNLTGLTKEALAARTQLIEEAKALGFQKLKITGQRIPSSSSGNPGHPIDITVDLTK